MESPGDPGRVLHGTTCDQAEKSPDSKPSSKSGCQAGVPAATELLLGVGRDTGDALEVGRVVVDLESIVDRLDLRRSSTARLSLSPSRKGKSGVRVFMLDSRGWS